MFETEPAATRVARGVEFLDGHYGPMWHLAIAPGEFPERFDIQSPCRCVLGWTHGGGELGETPDMDGYWAFLGAMFGEAGDSARWAREHGFVTYLNEESEVLQEEWERVILERLRARPAPVERSEGHEATASASAA